MVETGQRLIIREAANPVKLVYPRTSFQALLKENRYENRHGCWAYLSKLCSRDAGTRVEV